LSSTRPLSPFWVGLVTVVGGAGGGALGIAALVFLEHKYFADANGWRVAVPYLGAVIVGLGFNLLMLRLLRCPHCGRRFNWKNFRRDPAVSAGANDDLIAGMPERLCPRCGNDVYKAPVGIGTVDADSDIPKPSP
jgi:hypothetical protein